MRNLPAVTLFVCPLRTPANAGMIFRIAEGFGVKKIYFEKSAALKQETVIKKKSRGASALVPFEITDSLEPVIHDFLSEPGTWLIGLENTNEAMNIHLWKPEKNIPLRDIGILAGSENTGIPEKYLHLCHCVCNIPMFGKLTSHNVHVAVAIGLYEIYRTFTV